MHVERRLTVCPGIRGTDLHAELRHHYQYEGSYPAFQRHLRPLRPAVVRDPEIRFETGPGEQTQADWAELGPWPLGTEMVELSAMVTILGNSRAPAVRFATDRTRETSLDRVLWCLHDLGGVTREILTDRDSAFVTKPDNPLTPETPPSRSFCPRPHRCFAVAACQGPHRGRTHAVQKRCGMARSRNH
jgi:transposase